MKYVTEKGDTFKTVAAKFNIEVDAIKKSNPELTRMKTGIEIEIPDLKEIIEEDEIIVVDDENEEVISVKEVTKTYIVCTKKGGNLNVRKTPNGEIVKVVENGRKIEVFEVLDGWAKIEDGYVRQDLIKEE